MQWVMPGGSATFLSRSADGYYGIQRDERKNVFVAYYVCALWAKPERIDEAVTLGLAQQICEDHRNRPESD